MRLVYQILILSTFATLFGRILDLKKHSLSKEFLYSCKKDIDTLTKTVIYLKVDKVAQNEGGQVELIRKYTKIKLDSIPEDFETNFGIAFIVNKNGAIIGERVIEDKTGRVGIQMILIAKSLKWIPAECNGKKVPSIVKLPLQICFSRD